MNTMGISTDPTLLNVELPATLIESPSVSTFLPEEEASICPLLSTTNGTSTPVTFSHPLTPCIDNDSTASANLCNDDADAKVETSSSGSSSGIGMDAPDTAATTLFHKSNAYQHLQVNNGGAVQDTNGPNGTLSKDTPSFVSWNWPLIRKCTFFIFMSSLLAMCAVVVAMLATLPKTCNPKTAWYRGSVFYEIFPASFQDSNNDGIGDLRGISQRADYLASLSVAAVRLNSIFPSTHYPDDFEQPTSVFEVAHVLGNDQDVEQLAETLHQRNISLLFDLPIGAFLKKLDEATTTATTIVTGLPAQANNETDTNDSTATTANIAAATKTVSQFPNSSAGNVISAAILKWLQLGVDGFYLKGLENFVDDERLLANLHEWKQLVGPNRILIANEALIHELHPALRSLALHHLDLVDVHLDVLNGTRQLEEHINKVLSGPLTPTEQGPWLHWSIGGVDRQRFTRYGQSRNITLAATIMQLMLPGTPNIFYGDEIALEAIADPHSEHNETKHLHHLSTMEWLNTTKQFTNRETLSWLPQTARYSHENIQTVMKMIKLRDRSPSLYKNAICKPEMSLSNTEIRCSNDDILVVERVYPRRNSFVSVSNFGQKRVSMDMTAMYFSGVKMLDEDQSEKIYFSNFEIGPWETIVVKLDK